MDADGNRGASRDHAAAPQVDEAPGSWLEEGRALASDLKEWFDLKVKHTQLQLQAAVERRLAIALVRAVIATLGAASLLFVLLAVALGLGRWTGFPSAGFAIVGLFLLLVATVVWLLRNRLAAREPTAMVSLPSLDVSSTSAALPRTSAARESRRLLPPAEATATRREGSEPPRFPPPLEVPP